MTFQGLIFTATVLNKLEMTSTQKVWDVLLANEKYMNKMEHAYAKRLIKWSGSASSKFDHLAYLDYLQSLKLAKQKAEVTFLEKIFACADIRLNFFELRFYQNESVDTSVSRLQVKKKCALAPDEEIQTLVLKNNENFGVFIFTLLRLLRSALSA